MKFKNLFYVKLTNYCIIVGDNIFSVKGTIEFQKQEAAQSAVLVRQIYLNFLINMKKPTTVIKKPFWPALYYVF